MIKLNKLRLKGIGRFVDLQEISFENLGNLVQIDGQNNNTGGSSGSGKSTIFNALDFLFGLNTTPNTMLQSRLTEESIFVEGEFDLDGKSLIISRGKKLKIELDGDVTTGSSKVSEEKLDQIIGIPRHLFRLMTHKRQGEKGFFLSLTPSEMNSFLTDCLGLSNFKNNIINLDVKIVDLSKKIGSLTTDFESNNAALKASNDALLALGEAPVKDVDQNIVLELQTKVMGIQSNLAILSDKLKREEEEFILLNKPKIESDTYDASLMEKYEKEIQDIYVKLAKLIAQEVAKESARKQEISEIKLKQSELKNKIQLGITAKEQAVKAAAEILKIRKNMCPRCEQSWINDASKLEEVKILENINNFKGIIVGGENAAIQLKSTEETLAYLLSVPQQVASDEEIALNQKQEKLKRLLSEEKFKKHTHEDERVKTNRAKYEEFDKGHTILRTAHSQVIEEIRGNLDIHRRSFEAATMKLKNYEEARVRFETTLSNLMAQKKRYGDKHQEINKELENLKQQLGIAEELKKAIKSYLSCSFDEALEIISENATKMIQNIPNMATATVVLEGLKETKDGKVKEEVIAVLHMDGEENIPIKTLSGGERASSDIAVDLAALGLIEERSGKGLNIYAMDEVFNGLDNTNIEMVLEILKNANMNKKLIIIEHNPVAKEQISDRITIVRNGLTSKIVQN